MNYKTQVGDFTICALCQQWVNTKQRYATIRMPDGTHVNVHNDFCREYYLETFGGEIVTTHDPKVNK